MEKTLEAYFIKEFEDLKEENKELKNGLDELTDRYMQCSIDKSSLARENETLKKIICKFVGNVEKGSGNYWHISSSGYISEFDYTNDEEARKEIVLLMEKAYEIQQENDVEIISESL